jgi:hypothetical protein
MTKEKRDLTHPVPVRSRSGEEIAISEIGRAIRFLETDLKRLETTTSWIQAHGALQAAHKQYDDGHRNLATKAFEQICEKAGVLGK